MVKWIFIYPSFIKKNATNSKTVFFKRHLTKRSNIRWHNKLFQNKKKYTLKQIQSIQTSLVEVYQHGVYLPALPCKCVPILSDCEVWALPGELQKFNFLPVKQFFCWFGCMLEVNVVKFLFIFNFLAGTFGAKSDRDLELFITHFTLTKASLPAKEKQPLSIILKTTMIHHGYGVCLGGGFCDVKCYFCAKSAFWNHVHKV